VFRKVLRAQAANRDMAGARVIVVVDQFDEVFTFCADAVARNAFVELLCNLAYGTRRTPACDRAAGRRSRHGARVRVGRAPAA
jgi:hypothetical protein